ncbi:MAG TPA: Ig-like domain-containing protein, partial [Herpetosiphonaceae bacterium]
SPASYAWTIDTTPPPAPVTNTPANSSVTNNPLPPITGSAEPGATLTVFIDGSAAGTATADGSGNWSFTPSVPLGNGAHTARARASDPAGNTSVDSNTNTFTVDTVEPDTTLTATPPSPTSSTSANFSFTGAGTGSAVARFECSLDGAAFATCASPQNLSGLAEGSRTFRVRAVDAAGNTDTTPASFTWLIDLTAPDTTITANPPVLSNSANATFAFTGNDGAGSGVASFECSLDGGAFTACASGLTLTGLSDGAHTFAVRAIDNAGNVDGSPASYAWTVDTTPPPAPLTNTPANGSVTNNPLPPVTGSAESGAVVTVFIDGSSIGTVTADASGNWSLTPPAPLTDGTHTTRARASDPAGNTSVDSNTNTFTVDTAEPDTTLTATPPAISNSASASFAFTGAGTGSAVARFECSLDGAPFATCASPQNLSGLAEGSRTFRVRAVDIAGNTESTPASFTWRIDLTAPDTTITANPTNPSASANASFSFSGNDGAGSGVASLECSLDGATFAACASPQSYAGLADGSHTFAVRAIDAAGNVDASPASFTWLIDTTPAQVTINQASGQADPAATAPISFTVVFSEPVSGFGSAPGDIDLSASTAPGTLAATVTGSGTTYAVVVSGMRGPGLVIASVPAGAASDPAGNASAASTSSDNRVTFNPSIPAVAAIVRAGASPTRAATVDFTVTFSEPVLNVDTADFALALSGVTGASITGVTGSGATWTVTAATGAGNGALGLNLIDNDSILSSRAAIPLGGDGAGNGNATGESYVINRNYYVYLPQVQRPSFANLTASVRISPQRSMFAAGEPVVVTVTITNTGNAPAAPFWVDLYLNPRQAPAANQPWNTLCGLTPCFGLAWAVSSPLAPGQSVTLASTPGSYAAGQSVWPGWLPSGTTEIVALVDSFGPSEAGAVAESNEADNRATLRGLTVTGQNPPARPSQPALAPRGDPASAE